MESTFLHQAKALTRVPTAPFHEQFTLDLVRTFAAERPRIQTRYDRNGNCLLLYDGGGKSKGELLVLTAHLDHPGLVWHQAISPGRSLFEILGGVDLQQVLQTGMRIFDLHRPATQRGWKGKIVGTTDIPSARYPLLEIQAAASSSQGPGTFAMWDVAAYRLRGRRLSGRALDDLAGAAVGLSVLDQLHKRRSKGRIGLLLTRAEEVGFVGMLAALEAKFLPRRALYINIECSSVKAGAIQGAGPIIRVGDRLWVFDPQISGGLVALARDLEQTKPSFCFQRKLMDSGACEATALMQAGYRTGAVALPLGNYHNSGPSEKLATENINVDDAIMLAELLIHLAQQGIDSAQEQSSLQLSAMLSSRLDKYRANLTSI